MVPTLQALQQFHDRHLIDVKRRGEMLRGHGYPNGLAGLVREILPEQHAHKQVPGIVGAVAIDLEFRVLVRR